MSKKFIVCAYSNEEVKESDSLRFVLSPDCKVLFDLDNSFRFLKQDLLLYIKWEFVLSALSSGIFRQKWQGCKWNFTIDDIKDELLKKFLNILSFAKKAGCLTLGKNNIKSRISRRKKESAILVQATDSSEGEKFSRLGYDIGILEYFDSLSLSKACGKENIHYLLVEGSFVKNMLDIQQKIEKCS